MTTPKHEKEDILINFRDLFTHILLRWRSILAVAAVMTLLAGGAKLMMDYKDYKAALQNPGTPTVTLTQVEQANVDHALAYQQAYEDIVRYNNFAPLMQIDYTATPTMLLTYTVKSANSYNTAVNCQAVLRESAIYEELAAADDLPYGASYLPELVTVEILQQATVAAPADPVLLQVTVIADSEALCKSLTATLEQKLDSLPGCTRSGKQYYVAMHSGVRGAQIGNLNSANSLRTASKGAKDALTDRELAAFEKRLSGEVTDDGITVPAKPTVSKKFLVLGFVAGGALMVIVYALGYLTGRRVKSAEDLQERFGLYHMGTLPATGKARFLDPTIKSLLGKKPVLSAQEATALALQQLRLTAKDGALLLTGSALTDADADALQPLAEALQKEGIALTVVPCPLRDAAAMQTLAEAKAVVLAEKAYVSSYNDIYGVLQLCDRLEVPVHGTLLM